ncbi:hypothetical protein LPJ53_004762 [Coemansia erecta]|uniref:Amino acid transporter n=1 Tax=Coemansia erecta TaxID=147472 RepID=A0A9W7XXT1_9FUNG|nr:hypothetical protein LPJ53_004762 [Coemansia erecta]
MDGSQPGDIPLRVQRARVSGASQASIQSLDEDVAEALDAPLERRLGLWSGMAIVMGSIIGSGIFSTPSLILGSVGSVGMSILVWVIGAVVSICGCAAYMELGTMLPRSGGEKAYLEAAFPWPRELMSFVFCLASIFVCWPTGLAADAVVTGSYLLYAATGTSEGHPAWAERMVGVGVAVLCALAHACFSRWAIRVQNVLTVVKALLLVLVVLVGLSQLGRGQLGHDVFAGTSRSANGYATALFKVFFAYSGYTALNYAVDELKDPARTLPRAAMGGLAATALLYVMSNVAYFIVLDADEVRGAGTTVAGVFFTRVLGAAWGQRVVPVLIASATLGNVMCGSFAASRVIFAAARDGYVPLGGLWGSVSRRFGTPVWALAAGGLLTSLYIVVPPPGQAYALLIDMGGYPFWLFSGLAIAGLLRMRRTHGELLRPFRAWMPANCLSLAAAVFMCAVPFVRPGKDDGAAQEGAAPYWAAPVVGVAFVAASCCLWYVRALLIDRIEYRKQINEDQI